jgi:hypothetical protein
MLSVCRYIKPISSKDKIPVPSHIVDHTSGSSGLFLGSRRGGFVDGSSSKTIQAER